MPAPGSRPSRPARRPCAASAGTSRSSPPDADSDSLGPPTLPTEPSGPTPAGYRLRLAVADAARDGDQDATALVREGPRYGLDVAELLAVAEAHWSKPQLHRRAWRAGRRWTAARWRRLHRP